jgi:hypothetical protein
MSCAFQSLVGETGETIAEPAKAVARKSHLSLPALVMRQL